MLSGLNGVPSSLRQQNLCIFFVDVFKQNRSATKYVFHTKDFSFIYVRLNGDNNNPFSGFYTVYILSYGYGEQVEARLWVCTYNIKYH